MCSKVASAEIIIALLLRLAVSVVSSFGLLNLSQTVLNVSFRLFFYIIVKAQFDLVIGWISLYSVINIILTKSQSASSQITKAEQQIQLYFRVFTAAFWVLLVLKVGV